jgi:N-acetylglucosamine-6-phosphate deacetylase
MITLAPELPGALNAISALTELGIISSMGHSEATYEEAQEGVAEGATMITHLFNAMKPLHHRNPGMFGLLGNNSSAQSTKSTRTSISSSDSRPDSRGPAKPYFGIIADGIHLHPTSISIAYFAHPSGLVLVTDAMPLTGMPDGTYPWTNGSNIVKRGNVLTLEENGKIAGSSITLVECVSNFMEWTGASVPEAIRAVTETPARLLRCEGVKGSLGEGKDADLVVLDLQDGGEGKRLVVDQAWKFGVKVFERDGSAE